MQVDWIQVTRFEQNCSILRCEATRRRERLEPYSAAAQPGCGWRLRGGRPSRSLRSFVAMAEVS